MEVHGWLFVYKPPGWLSTKVVSIIKKQFPKSKVGHGGTLDPMAEGVLPIALGEATKTVDYVLNKDKTYLFTIQFGIKTDTKDMEGQVIQQNNEFPSLNNLNNVLSHFQGSIQQTPPKFSAIKIEGQRAYDLARKGVDFKMPTREVTIHELSLIDYNSKNKTVILRANVSKGTYIRTLGEDIAEYLGCIGCVSYLKREKIHINKEIVLIDSNMIYNIKENVDDFLLSVEYMLDDILAYILTKNQAIDLLHGRLNSLIFNKDFPNIVFTAMFDKQLIALLEYNNGVVRFLRVFNNYRHLIN